MKSKSNFEWKANRTESNAILQRKKKKHRIIKDRHHSKSFESILPAARFVNIIEWNCPWRIESTVLKKSICKVFVLLSIENVQTNFAEYNISQKQRENEGKREFLCDLCEMNKVNGLLPVAGYFIVWNVWNLSKGNWQLPRHSAVIDSMWYDRFVC